MPSEILRDAKVWLAHYDISGDLNAVALTVGRDLRDATTLGQTGRIRRAGLTTVAVQVEGYWVGDTIDAQLNAAFGVADTAISIAPGERDAIAAGAEGGQAYLFRAVSGEYEHGGSVGEMAAFSMGAESSDGSPLIAGTVMHNAARSTSASGTARNLGVVAAGQSVYGALHVVAVTGGTLDVTISSDTAEGFATPATVLTFAQATGVTSSWASAAGPLTDSWWRVNWTIGGGGTFTFIVTLGIR